MKKFKIIEERIVTGSIFYEWIVEANDENEAIDIIVKRENIEPVSVTDRTESDVYDSEFNVEEIHL